MSISQDQKFKADHGKLQARLLFEGMPKSLMLLCAVLSYGAQKYEAHSWKNVESDRYADAKFRHLLEDLAGFSFYDDESGLLHDAHEIINSMFILEQYLDRLDEEEFRSLLRFNKPPQDHKNG